MHFKVALEDPEFVENNEAQNAELDISIPKLRNKYNNLKKSTWSTWSWFPEEIAANLTSPKFNWTEDEFN